MGSTDCCISGSTEKLRKLVSSSVHLNYLSCCEGETWREHWEKSLTKVLSVTIPPSLLRSNYSGDRVSPGRRLFPSLLLFQSGVTGGGNEEGGGR